MYGDEIKEKGNENENLGIKDVMLALRWVKENLGALGGDVEKVTIQGVFGVVYGGTVDCYWHWEMGGFVSSIYSRGWHCEYWNLGAFHLIPGRSRYEPFLAVYRKQHLTTMLIVSHRQRDRLVRTQIPNIAQQHRLRLPRMSPKIPIRGHISSD